MSVSRQKLSLYRAFLRAQYNWTKLFNFLHFIEFHKNAVVLYGDMPLLRSLALMRGAKVSRIVTPPIYLSTPFEVSYKNDDLVIFTGVSQGVPDDVKSMILSTLSNMKCIKWMRGKQTDIKLLAREGEEECKLV